MIEQSRLLALLVDRSAAAIEANGSLLTRLDQEIGDGDHGINMMRGFSILQEIRDEISAHTFGGACQKAGMALVMSVGGASGPLFGSCLMAFGKGRAAMPETQTQTAAMLTDGIAAVMARGKSGPGQKTMLDVLVPVAEHIGSGGSISVASVRQSAADALEKIKPLEALKGRASFLGKRSIGHIDPGAMSVALIINAVCDVLEEAP